MEKILISACLVGENCKYDGGNNLRPWIEELQKRYELVPFCPEVEAGLPTPRTPAEISHGIVRMQTGRDVTKNFNQGAEKALNLCRFLGIKIAILKEWSPSCGVKEIYDGTFRHKAIKGMGITAYALNNAGVKIISDTDVESWLRQLNAADERRKAAKEAKLQAIKEGKTFESTSPKTFGEKKKFAKKKSFGQDEEKPFRKSFRKPFKDSEEQTEDNGDRKPFARRKSFGDRKPYGERKSFGGKKPFGRKPFKKDFGEGKGEFGDRKPYRSKKSFGDKSYGDKKPFGRKPFGKPGFKGARKPYAKKTYKKDGD